jgi:threonine/homoserine/homoserine lactone efflux protein
VRAVPAYPLHAVGDLERVARQPRVAALFERTAGVLLIGAGLRMATLRRAG